MTQILVELPLVGPSAEFREKGLSSQITKNFFPQINRDGRNVVSMPNTAGLKPFSLLEGADRAMHDFNGTMFTVNGKNLYSIDSDAIDAKHGIIQGTDRCVMANDSTQLIITTGGTPYRYTTADGLEEITDPDLVNPISVAYLKERGWSTTAMPGVLGFAGGGWTSDPWPPGLCDRFAPGGNKTLFWIIPVLNWRGDVRMPTLVIELIGYLVACPTNDLLWRDKVARRASMETVGPIARRMRANVKPESVNDAVEAAVGYLMDSMDGK